MDRKKLLERKYEIEEQMKNLRREQEKINDELIRDAIDYSAKILDEMINGVEERYARNILDDIVDTMNKFVDNTKYEYVDCSESHLNGCLLSEHCKSKYAFLIRNEYVYLYDVVEFFKEESKERLFLVGDADAEEVCDVIYDWYVEER
ncbi:MAG: hypothetical protein J6Y78_11340 [Paludibacteraceae bacterium]|nr:hypothetical protein [Paludibacteraceae bacterium]